MLIHVNLRIYITQFVTYHSSDKNVIQHLKYYSDYNNIVFLPTGIHDDWHSLKIRVNPWRLIREMGQTCRIDD